MRTSRVVLFLILFTAMFTPSRIWAQADRGAIKGETQDAQKAGVPNVQLTLKNEATGVAANATSGDSGQFSFLNLPAGVYSLTAEAKGFSTAVQQHIVVGVGSTVPVPVTLQTGEVQQTVTVSGNAAAVETQTSDIGTVITPEEIKNLPVSLSADMRNPLNFVVLAPGVYGSTPGATPDYRLHISGGASYGDEVYIDGVPVMNPDLTGDISRNHPPLDAIGQFKLINNNQPAQYGLSSGIVSFAFKSGTNAFHGSIFEYLQNDALNAAGSTFNALRARTDCTITPLPPGCKKPGLKQNEYGGTFGGPVWIPKLYNGRDKTFFFVDYTGFTYRPSSLSATLTTIPNAYRTGNFSQALGPQLTSDSGAPIFDPAGRPVYQGAIYNPLSVHNVVGPDGKSYPVRDPFPGNIIPPGTPGLSAVSQNILKYYPQASTDSIVNNLLRLQNSKIDEHRLVVKIDEHISEKNSLSGSFFSGKYAISNNGFLNLFDATTTTDPFLQIRLSHNYTFSSTLLNNLNIGYLRDHNFFGPLQAGPGLDTLGLTGLPPFSKDSPFPQIGLPQTGINNLGSTAGGASAAVANRYYVNDNLTMIRGAHTFTFGGEVRREQLNNGGIPSGGFTFDPVESGLNGTGFAGGQAVALKQGTGNSAASFLFGGMDYVHIDYPIAQYYRWWQTGVFAQDDWKATPNLTLNLGLRYDVQVPRTEKFGNVSSMNPTVPNPAAGGLPGAYTFYGNGPGRNGKPRIGNIYYKGFQPRLGFAYSPDAEHKTAIRGGFSMSRPIANDNLQGTFTGGYDIGFAGLAQTNRPQDYVGSPAYYWDSAFPASGVVAPGAALSPATFIGNGNPVWIGADAGLPPTQIYWTAQIQQQVSNSMVLNIGYVGSHTYHVGNWSKPNQINPAGAQAKYGAAAAAAGLPLNLFMSLPITDPRVANAGFTPPFPGFVALFGDGATLSQASRPTPQYGDTDHPLNPIASNSYNGLLTSLQKRFSQGLTFLLSYTFSKTIGDVDSNSGPSAGAENAIFAGSFFQDYYNPKAERAVTSSDIPHVVSLSYTYELPIGPGKPFLNHKGVVGTVVGGWSVSGIQQYQSGRPIHIEYDQKGSSNYLFAAGDGFSYRPNIVPNQPFKNPAYKRSCSGPVQTTAGRDPCQFYINPAAFSLPPAGGFGNAPNFISALRLPAYVNEDLSVSKRTTIHENLDLQFQANFFNAFNRTIFSAGGNPNTFIINNAPPDLSSGSLGNSNTVFGIMAAQQNAPRIIQFGARLEF
ncbi:MAG: carboxypeptidase regulatory-like domain-containing protein [Acidobacteriaceae bacterium]